MIDDVIDKAKQLLGEILGLMQPPAPNPPEPRAQTWDELIRQEGLGPGRRGPINGFRPFDPAERRGP